MIRWGIIGCGDVTEHKSGPGFQNADHSSLVAVMRRDAGKAADYARRHGVPRWYADADALIRDPQVDAVSIATPPASHCELALRVAAAGKPALVEKPMARDHGECVRMIEAFRAAGVPLFVAYYRRALPKFLKVQSLLAEGAVGRVLAVDVKQSFPTGPVDRADPPWRFRPDVGGGGLFVDLASHSLDLMDWLFGPVAEAAGFADRTRDDYGVEDAVVLCFRHSNGVQGTGRWHFTAQPRHDWVEIVGTGGYLGFAVFGPEPIVLRTEHGEQTWTIGHPPAIQQPFIQTVVDHLEGRGRCASTGDTASRTSRVMDQVLKPFYARLRRAPE